MINLTKITQEDCKTCLFSNNVGYCIVKGGWTPLTGRDCDSKLTLNEAMNVVESRNKQIERVTGLVTENLKLREIIRELTGENDHV